MSCRYLATHDYSCTPGVTLQYLKRLYDRYGYKIWLTEFSCGNTLSHISLPLHLALCVHIAYLFVSLSGALSPSFYLALPLSLAVLVLGLHPHIVERISRERRTVLSREGGRRDERQVEMRRHRAGRAVAEPRGAGGGGARRVASCRRVGPDLKSLAAILRRRSRRRQADR